MELLTLILLRVGALTGERVSFHGLGRKNNVLVTTVVAYGGAAVFLWGLSGATGHLTWIGQAFWPGSVYAVSFALYTAALARGSVGVVSGFSNVTVLMLFVLAPRWDVVSVAGLGLFLAGSWLLIPRGSGLSWPVAWMSASGMALVIGRLLDASHLPAMSLPYAASLFTAVVLWISIPVTLYGLWGDAVRLVRCRPAWVGAACGFNGFSYVTVLELLRWVSPTVVEAVSACAGVGATVAGVAVFGEGQAVRKSIAAAMMTIATLIMLFSRAGVMR